MSLSRRSQQPRASHLGLVRDGWLPSGVRVFRLPLVSVASIMLAVFAASMCNVYRGDGMSSYWLCSVGGGNGQVK